VFPNKFTRIVEVNKSVVKIAICDDEIALINELKELLSRYAVDTGREFCFFEFHDGIELLENYQPDFDLIFLDIKMEKLNGLKTAEEIRKTDSTVGLFFLTSLSQYVWKGYEYGAINYLLKPMKYGRLKMSLTASSHAIRAERSRISVFQTITVNIRCCIKICAMLRLPSAMCFCTLTIRSKSFIRV